MQTSSHFFKHYLNEELKKRCLKNPSYSLRSFAKSLGHDASNLSKYMSGQRTITNRLYLSVKLSLKLKFDSLEEFAKDYATQISNSSYFYASEDIFSNLGELQAAVLAEMLSLNTVVLTVENLSKLTSYSEESIETILLKMEEIGLAHQSDGIWSRKQGIVNYKLKSDMDLIIRNNLTLAEQMISSLHCAHDDVAQTHITGVISTDSKKIEEARARIIKFRRELIEWLETAETKDTTFGVYLSVFPLIKT
jgi:hypothetical protein